MRVCGVRRRFALTESLSSDIHIRLICKELITVQISPVSIVGCFAACSETAFSSTVMGCRPGKRNSRASAPFRFQTFRPPSSATGGGGLQSQTCSGARVRETRIVALQVALLAISDAPPAFIRLWRRQAPIPLTFLRFALTARFFQVNRPRPAFPARRSRRSRSAHSRRWRADNPRRYR